MQGHLRRMIDAHLGRPRQDGPPEAPGYDPADNRCRPCRGSGLNRPRPRLARLRWTVLDVGGLFSAAMGFNFIRDEDPVRVYAPNCKRPSSADLRFPVHLVSDNWVVGHPTREISAHSYSNREFREKYGTYPDLFEWVETGGRLSPLRTIPEDETPSQS